MAIPKWKKITIWIGGFVSLIVLLALFKAYGLFKSGGYIKRNPKKFIARIERIFEIDFPDDIKDLRVATSLMEWDNWTTYIIKFRVEPKSLDTFIKVEHLSHYDPNTDERAKDILPPPQWYSEAIQQGRMGILALDCPRDNADAYEADVYVDTSDDKSFVVYIQGSYHSGLNKLVR